MSCRSYSLMPIYFAAGCFVVTPAAATNLDLRSANICTQDSECDDDNLCTADSCDPKGQCSNVPNYDSAADCCHPTTGQLLVIECDPANCYDVICFPTSCTCCDRPDGDPCANCDDVNDCSGNGACIATNTCLCETGWTESDCSAPTCTDVDNCSGNGSCIGPNTCQCNEGFIGPTCATFVVPVVSHWALVTMTLLVLTAGTLVVRSGGHCKVSKAGR